MRCPYCGEQDTRVVDSRLSQEGDQVRRRRECVACHERFTTHEVAELAMPRIIKADGRREAFREDKLRAGMLRALEKCPVESDSVEAAISRIKKSLLASGDREVASRVVGECIMNELRGLDHVAYIRFASVYRRFEDIQQFREVIEHLAVEAPESLASVEENQQQGLKP